VATDETGSGSLIVGDQAVTGSNKPDTTRDDGTCPLYAEARTENPWDRKPGDLKTAPSGNEGLRFDKFVNTWKRDFTGFKDEKSGGQPGKTAWIASFAGKVGDESLLNDAHARRAAFLTAHGTRSRQVEMRTEWRFVTGLGREHPVENGFAWHHTLGVPYLPGSSLKGLLRAWCREVAEATTDVDSDDRRALDQRIAALFGAGPTSEDPDSGVIGGLIVLDVLPVAPVELRADVMTPHYQPYHTASPENPPSPGDWFSPNPIPFLTVAPGQAFCIALLARTEAAGEHLGWVFEHLQEALAWMGAGAKTATGYGRLVPVGGGDL